MTSPVQVALRELLILTRCYCDGEHPRLGHNCSFRPDVVTVVNELARLQTELTEARRAVQEWQRSWAEEHENVERLQSLCDKTAIAAANRALQKEVDGSDRPHSARIAEKLQRVNPATGNEERGPAGRAG